MDYFGGCLIVHAGWHSTRTENLCVSNALSGNGGNILEFTPSERSASGSTVPNIFLDFDPAGTNLNQPALFTFGPSISQRSVYRGWMS